MQTTFSPEQLADPQVALSESIVRKCVHCGLCTATCPTYVTLGNELDSPRGRIYLIKDMLENGRAADKQIVTHIDRCLSCLACTTTCPSGVDYMHLIDHARAHIQDTYKRPLIDRLIRTVLAHVLPYSNRFRAAVSFAKLGRPFAPLFDKFEPLKPLAAMLRLAPTSLPKESVKAPQNLIGKPLARVVILEGCAQPVLKPSINSATRNLLSRLNIEVLTPKGEGCCGALVHHMGREHDSLEAARRNIDAWLSVKGDLDAIIITASGCGTTIKDYGHLLRLDPAYAEKAAKVSALAKDITEFLSQLALPAPATKAGIRVAYHSACSMQHGQKIVDLPKTLLKAAGFEVVEPREGHLCCGSAGTYNILQPEISAKLLARKIANLTATKASVVATGNIGCITQIASAANVPVIHTIELLNWAYGGPKPDSLALPKQ
jgi:glycolate oxidase iron-sulfur subunit